MTDDSDVYGGLTCPFYVKARSLSIYTSPYQTIIRLACFFGPCSFCGSYTLVNMNLICSSIMIHFLILFIYCIFGYITNFGCLSYVNLSSN